MATVRVLKVNLQVLVHIQMSNGNEFI